MTLQQAIENQAEIICQNEQEREEVVKVLESARLRMYESPFTSNRNLHVHIFKHDMEYGIYSKEYSDESTYRTPQIAASQFLAANKINHDINPPLTC